MALHPHPLYGLWIERQQDSKHEKKMGGGACRGRREVEEAGLCVNHLILNNYL